MYCGSGIARSIAPAAIAARISPGPLKFSPIWIGVRTASAMRAQEAKSSASTGSSIQVRPSSSSALQRAMASGGLSDWL